MPPSLAIGYTYVTNDPLLTWRSGLTRHPVSSTTLPWGPQTTISSLYHPAGGGLHVLENAPDLSFKSNSTSATWSVWQCPVLHAQAGGRRAPPFLADGLASGLSVVQTPNLLPLKRLVQGQLVRSPVLGHLGTCISPFALQLVLFAVSLFLSLPLCLCPSLPSGSFPWIRLFFLWPEATQQVTWTPNEVSGRGRHPPGCATPPVMTGHLHFSLFQAKAWKERG